MLQDLNLDREIAANDVVGPDRADRERSVPITGSMTRIPGYPSKLVVYRIAASSYWQVRGWVEGKIRKRSTKTTVLATATAAARGYYEEWLVEAASARHMHAAVLRQLQSGEAQAGVQALADVAAKAQSAPRFGTVAAQMLANESARVRRGEWSRGSQQVLVNRLNKLVLPRWESSLCSAINYQALQAFVNDLSVEHTTTTINQYLVVIRKVLKQALAMGLIDVLPAFPHLRGNAQSRGAYTPSEYWKILRCARRLRGQLYPADARTIRLKYKIRSKEQLLPPDLAWAAGFMVNSFIRPSDLRTLKHRHIEIVRGENTYLRMNLPETKSHGKPIVTLYPAVRIYEQILNHQRAQGRGAPDDYLFLPHLRDRSYALAVLGFHLNWVLAETGLKVGAHGQARSMYSFRHSAITFRLLYGQGIDLLTLARNARTSVDVINTYYASTVTGEQNIALLQSRRSRKTASC